MTDQDLGIAFAINVVLALFPATIAKRKGYPFIGWWILGILFSWIIILLVAIFVRRRLPRQTLSADIR